MDKVAFEDARYHQLAMEYERRARSELAGVVSMQAEAADAWEAFKAQESSFVARYLRRCLGL